MLNSVPSSISVELVSKFYGETAALLNVSFALRPGEITAIVGKNGSGKSTLIKILSGVVQPDQGELKLNGVPRVFNNPADAMRAGVATVHQELSILPAMSVAENIVLGNWPESGRFGKISYRKMRQIARDILDELGETDIHVDQIASSLSTAQRQIVEIARALVQNPKILLLDEPFSTLSEQEVDVLIERIRAIAAKNISVAFVSHRLGEVKDLATSIFIIRDGVMISDVDADKISVEDIASKMLGTNYSGASDGKSHRPLRSFAGEPLLSLRNFSVLGKFSGLDLDLHRGEVLGVAGLLGSGRTEFLRALIGMHPCRYDKFAYEGKDFSGKDLRYVIESGIDYVPEERKTEGFVPGFSVLENLCLPKIVSSGIFSHIHWSEQSTKAKPILQELSVKLGHENDRITTLSGGNQQKVVIGKWIYNDNMKLLLMDEPSRGVDIQARQQIEALILRLAEQGVSFIIAASEMEELFNVCDRLILIGNGRVIADTPCQDASVESITVQLMNAQ